MWERLAKTLHFLELITANANLDPKLDKQPETLQQIPNVCVVDQRGTSSPNPNRFKKRS